MPPSGAGCKTSRALSSRPHRAALRLALSASFLLLSVGATAQPSLPPEEVRVTVLQTSDLHCHLLPWDYARGKEEDIGLARIATRVAAIRAESPNVLLLDGGDTIQGTPIAYLQARKPDGRPDPMAAAMSAMRYDAMSLGNHELNFGLDVLRKAQKESSFPWLSANTRNAADGSPAFPEYVVKVVGGVRVGVLGLTTPNIPSWEPEPNRRGLLWEDPVVTAKRLVPILRSKEKADLVVVLVHSGLEVDPATGAPNGTSQENRVAALTREVPGLDLVLTGHSHRRVPLTRLNGVPVIQPGRWGEVLARVDVTLRREASGWVVGNVTGDLLPSDASVAADPRIAAIAAPYHERALAYLDEPLATAEGPFPADKARLEDSALLDLINDAQRDATGAQLSMTSLLPGPRFEGFTKGPITTRQVYGLYPYENQLSLLEIDGAILKECIEHAAEFYGAAVWDGTKLVLTPKPGMIPYNFDAVQGVSYRIDPTAPVGARVKELTYRGRDVKPEDRFTLAVNSYRAQGSGGYTALRRAKLLKSFPDEIRELLIDRLREMKTLVPRMDGNWTVAPDEVWSEAPQQPRP